MIDVVWRTLYDSVLIGAVVSLVALAVTHLPRQSASTRFATWLAALAIVSCGAPLAAFFPNTVTVIATGTPTGAADRTLLLLEVWALIAAAGLLRIAASFVAIINLKRRAVADVRLQSLIDSLAPARRVRGLITKHHGSPCFAGFGRPAIIVPSSVAAALDDETLLRILAHELAHAARRDDWSVLVQRVARAVLFFNPAVILIARRMELERELACDEHAATRAGDVAEYVKSICRLAELALAARTSGPTVAAAAITTDFGRRMSHLLLRPQRHPHCSHRTTLAATLLLIVSAMASAPLLATRFIAVAPTPSAPVDLDTEAAAHFGRGYSLYSGGDYRGSIDEYKQAIAMNFEVHQSEASIASAYKDLGDEKNAKLWAERASR